MITDQDTNFVYFSDQLRKYLPVQTKAISDVLDKYKVNYSFLKSTKDYYCRDYMPVQVSKKKFVQFVFNPLSYFQSNEYPLISNTIRILADNKLPSPPYYSRLILDGGNTVKSKNKVIITDKVYEDNEFQLSRKEIIKELEQLFEAEIIIIPAIPGDKTGHADGMVRFVDENKIITNQLSLEKNPEWEAKFKKVMKDYDLNYREIPVFDGIGAIGIYINFLQVGNLIIVPFFKDSKQKNDDAIKVLEELYPGHYIEPVLANDIAEQGGVFNCASWNILKIDKPNKDKS